MGTKMIRNYLKIAWRSIAKNKLYSIINILGLSLGIAVCMLITLFAKDEFSFDRFQKNKDEIYRLVIDDKSPKGTKNTFGDTGMNHGDRFSKQIPEIEALVRIKSETFNVKHKNEIFEQQASRVDSAFFTLFNADFIEGNPAKSLASPTSIVISEKVSKRYFGNEKAVGKTLALEIKDKLQDFQITGVTRNTPENSSVQIELLIPFDYSKPQDNVWLNFYLNTFFKIKKGANLANVEQKMANIFDKEAKQELLIAKKEFNYDSFLTFKLQPFTQMHLSREYRAQNGLKESSNATLSFVLSGLALFILLIACINFVNITTSHSIQRSKEIGIRKVIGSHRKQLIFQFLGESFLLCFCAFLLALLWVQLALPSFNTISNKALSFKYLLDFKLVMSFSGLFLLTSLSAGFYPSIVLSAFQPVEVLYGRFKLNGKNLLQKSLIVLQFGLATFFIIITLVQFRQVNLFTSKNLGYDAQNLAVVYTQSNDPIKGEAFIQELKVNANIVDVAPHNMGQGSWNTLNTVNGNQQIQPDMNVINENYINTLGLKIVAGRNFSKDFPADSTLSVLVNEAYVKEAKWKNPIGQTVRVLNRENYKVVGVVKDYHYTSLYENVKPQLFLANINYGSFNTFFIKMQGANNPKTLEFINEKFKKMYPTKPYTYELQTVINEKQYDKEKQAKQIILWAAIIIIFISSMGLFGLSVLTTEKRKKEIGIRKVLGASLTNIVQKLSIDYLKLILISFSIFAPIAYYVGTSMLQNYPYRITLSADIFVICLIGLVGITFITVSYHSLKAAIANPVKSLKTE
jgi:putative ABC transport system permease protein